METSETLVKIDKLTSFIGQLSINKELVNREAKRSEGSKHDLHSFMRESSDLSSSKHIHTQAL